MRIGILTVSDRSYRGEREDLGGPALAQALREFWSLPSSVAAQDPASEDLELVATIVPDERTAISAQLAAWCDRERLDLVLTTGGTGFAPRDVTPEATLDVVERLAPGMAEVIRAESLAITRHAMLSRGVAGIRGNTLIVNLPGSPSGAVECLGTILPILPHAVEVLRGEGTAEQHHRPVDDRLDAP